MSPSPDELVSEPQGATMAEPSAPAQPESNGPTPGSSVVPATEAKDSPPHNLLLYSVLIFLCTGVLLWLLFAWSGYKEKYSQLTEGWHLGGTKMLEITLVREDQKNLACSSDRSFGDTHCGYHANGQPFGANAELDAHTLQPFNTIKNELFLGAGLWASPSLQGGLPSERFTVVCNYRVTAVSKSVALRWSPTGNFNPVDQSVAIGTLSDCVIPQ